MGRVSIFVFSLAILYLIIREIACNEDNSTKSIRDALLDFKNGLKDPNNRLWSWKGSDYCHWKGISCENDTKDVISIDLRNPYNLDEDAYDDWSSMVLSGEIRPSLIKLKSLRHLDLSFNSFNDNPIPPFFGFLKNLQYLNLSNAGFIGPIPPNIGNLSNLQHLDLSTFYFGYLFVENIEWMIGLVSLKHLEMNSVNLSLVGTQWMEVLNNLPVLTKLHLNGCNLLVPILLSTPINFTSLVVIDIGSNNFNYRFPEWLLNISSLVSISISFAELEGTFRVGEVSNLQYLDLWGNNFNSSVFSSIGKFRNLKYLDLSSNQIMGNMPEWLGELKNLMTLDLSENKMEGPIPDSLGRLQRMEELRLGWNELNGSLPESIGNLSQLRTLDVYRNDLSGSVTSQHFSKLHKLEVIGMGYNSFHLNWVPPFHLKELYMQSCHVGPLFPPWLHSQNNLERLHLSNASISGSIPNWFWNNISFNLHDLDLSSNQLYGELANSFNFSGNARIDFRFNFLEGPIPFPIHGVSQLYLSNNNFSGPLRSSENETMLGLDTLDLSNNKITGVIPLGLGKSMPGLDFLSLLGNQIKGFIPFNTGPSMSSLSFLSLSGNQITGSIPDSIGHVTRIEVIDFSHNSLSGSIPSTIHNCSFLFALDLGNNNFFGMIPESLGLLPWLTSLHLNHNKISGQLPSSFRNLSNLAVFDLSYNKLSGNIPTWIGTSLGNLMILSLRWNMFCGRLPSKLSNLSSLHVLDIAHNNLTGNIPVTLLQLKAMTQRQNFIYPLSTNENVHSFYQERLIVTAKGQSLEYSRTLSLVFSIELSDNSLSGEFPKEITKLLGLVVLNLSRNHISGQIPGSISKLHELSSLYLSTNNLSGTIPLSMASLAFLGYLNLSNNNFYGKIPFEGHMASFSKSAFAGNPNLCGDPLEVKCQGDDSDKKWPNAPATAIEEHDNLIDQWFYLSIGLGLATGVLVPYFLIAVNKSCYDVYFNFVDKIVYKLLLPKGKRGTSC